MLESLEAHFGISQSMLQFLILASGLALFLGRYWRSIVGGLGLLFVIYVFVHDPNDRTASPPIEANTTDRALQTGQASPQPASGESARIHDEFIADCITIADNEKEQCEDIWRETEPPEEGEE